MIFLHPSLSKSLATNPPVSRQYAAEQGIAEEAIAKGMEEKSKEFVEKGAEVFAGVRL